MALTSDEATYTTDNKSISAFRTIGETAEILGVAQHVLRFWEGKFSQIKPMKMRGRRYYRPEDIDLLNNIKRLLYTEGYTVKGVQKSLKDSARKHEIQTDLFAAQAKVKELEKEPAQTLKQEGLSDEEKIKLGKLLSSLYQSRDKLAEALAL